MTDPALRFPVGTIRKAIRELLEGSLGQTSERNIEPGVFKYGTFDGQPQTAEQAHALQTDYGRNWFNVALGRVTRNASTPATALGSYRLADMEVTIEVTTKAPTTVEQDERDEALAAVGVDLEQACAALGYPGNLETDASGDETQIVGGALVGPLGSDVDYRATPDWNAGLIRSRIAAIATVQIAQEV